MDRRSVPRTPKVKAEGREEECMIRFPKEKVFRRTLGCQGTVMTLPRGAGAGWQGLRPQFRGECRMAEVAPPVIELNAGRLWLRP